MTLRTEELLRQKCLYTFDILSMLLCMRATELTKSELGQIKPDLLCLFTDSLQSTTGVCLEYILKNDILAHLERLCEADRPHGVKGKLFHF